jgi:hypothetical protein
LLGSFGGTTSARAALKATKFSATSGGNVVVMIYRTTPHIGSGITQRKHLHTGEMRLRMISALEITKREVQPN